MDEKPAAKVTRPRRIVAEVSVTWSKDESLPSPLISQRFEHVIHTNEERGYSLESWQLTSTTPPRAEKLGDVLMGRANLVETIIAVFIRDDSPSRIMKDQE